MTAGDTPAGESRHDGLRSFLYAPGSNERIIGKALAAGADAVILDLEDAVAEPDKDRARSLVAETVRQRSAHAPCRIHVRINDPVDTRSAEDIDAVVHPGLHAIRIPKCVTTEQVLAVDHQIAAAEASRGMPVGGVALYPTVENATGLLAVREIARACRRVAAIAFGPADYAADLGLPEPVAENAMLLARSTLVLESRSAGIGPPVDGAFVQVRDVAGLRAVALHARQLGFAGKSAIHPVQLPVLHEIFTPTDAEVAKARAVLASLSDDRATAVVEGTFVDAAVVKQARRVIDLAARVAASPDQHHDSRRATHAES